MRDMSGENKPVQALETQVLTGDVNGATVDLWNFNGVLLVADVGASGDVLSGSVKVELEVEESDNGTAWTDAADADLTTAVTGTNTGTFAVIDDPAEDSAVYATAYKGNKRYVRVVANLTGTHTNGIPVGVVAVKGYPTFAPV